MVFYALYNALAAFASFNWPKLIWRCVIIGLIYWLMKHLMRNNLDLLRKNNRVVVTFFVFVKLVSIIVSYVEGWPIIIICIKTSFGLCFLCYYLKVVK